LLGNEARVRENFKSSKAQSDWQFVGEVAGSSAENKRALIFKPHNVLKIGEAIELLTPDNCYKLKVKNLFDKNGEKLSEVHGGTKNLYGIEFSKEVEPGWGLIRKLNTKL
jgi:hypothetical protein